MSSAVNKEFTEMSDSWFQSRHIRTAKLIGQLSDDADIVFGNIKL